MSLWSCCSAGAGKAQESYCSAGIVEQQLIGRRRGDAMALLLGRRREPLLLGPGRGWSGQWSSCSWPDGLVPRAIVLELHRIRRQSTATAVGGGAICETVKKRICTARRIPSDSCWWQKLAWSGRDGRAPSRSWHSPVRFLGASRSYPLYF